MLSIAYKGIGLPIFWSVLDLEGNSSTDDRIAILKRVIERFGSSRILAFTADREFVGKEWFEFLCQQGGRMYRYHDLTAEEKKVLEPMKKCAVEKVDI